MLRKDTGVTGSSCAYVKRLYMRQAKRTYDT